VRLPKSFACGVAVIAALLFLTAAAPSRAQNAPPSTTAPTSSPGTAPQSPQQPPSPPASSPPATSHSQHTVTVTFDYDFGQTPACSKKVVKGCVQQFVAYDISGGMKNATMLFPIPLPAKPVGAMHGITATSPLLDFESGKHLISVSAIGPDGRHSKRNLCTTWITIP
jgi:hypothetical protein